MELIDIKKPFIGNNINSAACFQVAEFGCNKK